MDGGADFETIRKWDKNHPENSIGTYDLTDEEKAEKVTKKQKVSSAFRDSEFSF